VTQVLVTDYTWASTEVEQRILAEVGASLIVAETGREDELIDLATQADGILTCFAQVTGRVIAAAPRLQVIGRYGIGVDNIDVAEATRRGIPVANVPAYCVDEVAEHVIALLMAHARGIALYDRAVRAGDWALSTGLPLRRVAGTTLGIVGFGRIGRALAPRGLGLGMEVLVCGHGPDVTGVPGGVSVVEIEELAARSDYISLHVPLTSATTGMVDKDFLSLMKPTAYLINTSRGAVIEQEALLDALEAGRLAGAALDVFTPERLPADHPLLASRRLLATPHVAFYSEQSVRELATRAAANVAVALSGGRPDTVVNPEVYGGAPVV
jgi:D-3-phosphoglycerate dehydrogenase